MMSEYLKIKIVGLCLTAFVLMAPLLTAQSLKNAEHLKNGKPLYGFIENKGQVMDQNHNFNPAAKYLLPLPNNNVVLRVTGFSYDTYIAEEKDDKNDLVKIKPGDKSKEAEKDITYKYHRVDVEFVGANPNPEIIAEERSTDFINYYVNGGQETQVYHFQKITYKNIYPDIDVEFLASPGEDKPVEYNFIVHPGGNMEYIRLSYGGANTSELIDGKLVLGLAHGKLTESIPASYYEQSKEQVTINYKHISSKGNQIMLAFAGDFNRSKGDLVIDPTPNLEWGTYYGGTEIDFGDGITTDASGNVYVVGMTNSLSSIATSGSFQSTYMGNGAAFVVKFNSSGVRQWGTYYNGCRAYSIVTDASANVYIAGVTNSNSSIATAGAHQVAFGGGTDAFVVKFNSSGVRQWSTYYGGDELDEGLSITTDGSGNLLLCGYTASSSSIATPGAYQPVYAGGSMDAFVVKFNSSGVRQWGTYYGGNGIYSEKAGDIATDVSGNIYITGLTNSTSQIATSGAHQTALSGYFDAFVAKFNSGGALQWGTYYGGTADEDAFAVSVDASGNIFIIGNTGSTSSISTPGTHQPTYGGNGDSFIAKFNSNGVRQWGTYYGGNSNEVSCSIANDAAGNVFITGWTNSNSGIASSGAHQTIYRGSWDAFIAKLNPSGMRLWGTYYGGSDSENGQGYEDVDLAVDVSNNIYITGTTSSTNFISTSGAHQTTIGGQYDAFIAKFSDCNPEAGSIGGTQTICLGAVPSLLTNLTPGFNGIYNWQLSADGTTWTDIPGATSVAYAPGALTITTQYRRKITGCGITVNTNPVTITVTPLPSPGKIQGTQTICSDITPTGLTNETSGTNGTYQWQSSPNNSSWIDIPGATLANHSPGALTATTYYRRNVVSTCGIVNSNVLTIVVNPLPIAGSIGNNQTMCAGIAPAPLTDITSGANGTYQWQISSGNNTWVNIQEATSSFYSPGILVTTTNYRRNVVSVCGIVSSNIITITVNPLAIAGSISNNQTICAGIAPAPLTSITAGANGAYQWQTSSDNVIWTDIPGAKLPNYSPGILNGYAFYRRNTVNACGIASTNVVTIAVTPLPIVGSIGDNQTVCIWATPMPFTNIAPGANGTYQWQLSTGNNTWTNITGATSATYTPEVSPVTTSYRRNVVSTCGTVSSNILTITVNPLPSQSYAGEDQAVCGMSTTLVGNIPSTGVGRWLQMSGPSPAVFGNTASPTTPVSVFVYGKYSYIWAIENAGCYPSVDVIEVTYYPPLTTSNAGADQNVCSLSTTLVGNTPLVGSGSWTQVSGPSATSFANTTSATSQVTVTSAGTYVYHWTISNSGCSSTTDDVAVTYTIVPPATFNYGPSASAYCNWFSGLNAPSNPQPSFTGGGIAGTFSASSTNLRFINVATGEVDLKNSSGGTYTITNTIPGSGGCPASISTATLTLLEPTTFTVKQDFDPTKPGKVYYYIEEALNSAAWRAQYTFKWYWINTKGKLVAAAQTYDENEPWHTQANAFPDFLTGETKFGTLIVDVTSPGCKTRKVYGIQGPEKNY